MLQSSRIPSLSGGGTSTGSSASATPSCPGGGTWTGLNTGAAATGAARGGAGRGCAGRGAGCWYAIGADIRGSSQGLNVIGGPPTGPQPAGVHPAPERPGIRVNHITTPTATG